MNGKKHVWWLSPYLVELTSISQYLAKGLAKIAVGTYVASPMLAGDGWHNMADIFQAAMVVMGIWLARRKLKEYPYGLRNLESILSLLIGVMLLWTVYKFASQSLLGLLAQFPTAEAAVRGELGFLPQHEPLRIAWRMFPWLVGLTSASVALSLVTSWFQIKAGQASGEGSLVADGKETRADSLIELATLGGVLLEYLLDWRIVEYIIGCVVAGFVTHTAYEIIKPAFDQLVQRSLGTEMETGIQKVVMAVCGVDDVTKIKTFRIGRSLGIVKFRIVSRLPAPAHDLVRKVLKANINAYLLEHCEGIKKAEVYITFRQPEADPHRVAYAAKSDGHGSYRIVTSSMLADCILLCDMFDGQAVRVEPYPIPKDLWGWLAVKHVSEFRMLDPKAETVPSDTHIRLSQAVSPLIETYDLSDRP